MKVIYTAIFGNYEELKEPKIITPGWEYICFTDQKFQSNTWQVMPVFANEINPQRLARFYKIMKWKAWRQSIWIDASFIINTNLDEWWNKYFRKGFSAARHPLRDCLYKEGEHCIRTRRGSEGVAAQLSAYRNAGHPRRSGLITSGLIMRENSPEVIALCNAWWSELQLYSIRDQVAFAKVAYKSDIVFTYDWNYIANNHFLYKKHFHLR